MTLQSEVPSREQGHDHHAYTELGGSGVRPPLQRRMHHYFEATCDRLPNQTALEWEDGIATYRELDEAANRMAHLIRSRYEVAGRRVGLLVPRSRDLYVALLAIQKAGAAWVPIDPSSPADRIEYFAQDSDLALLLTTSEFTGVLDGLDVQRLHLDAIADALAGQPSSRPDLDLEGDPTAYVIYTSGSTGRPKGVDIRQSSICNFLHVITELYDVRASDRVYQGMTISFDFAIEEVWPTWCVGAALIAGPTDGRRVGAGLTTFLEERAITLLYVVPTVLSTVERTIDSIRGLMVGGEACPSELVERWAPGRRMLNTYGPTEATVTCTVGILEPGRPVTIGIAVPTYTAWILDDQRRPVPQGGDGELCIGGVGVAAGYLNRPDLTADRFIPHPQNGDERIYRTGDLARIDERGEIVYLGRADAEVKIRGHRVDLGEIESVLMRAEGVHTAAVKHLKSGQTGDEISGYLVPHAGTARSDQRLLSLHDHLRDVLPPYMVPAYLEWVDELPMLASGKVDRKQLPDPTSARLVGGSGEIVPASTEMERWVLGVWAATFALEPEQLSVEANFFDDLGGHSLVAANVTSAMRRDERGAPMSIMDLYANPSVRTLAQHLDLVALGDASDREDEQVVQARETLRYPSWRVALFGFAQFLVVFAIVAFGTLPFAVIYALHEGRPSMAMLQEICLMFPVAYLAERWLLPVLVARVFGAGLRDGEHRLYGWTHLRVWLVTRAMSLSPMVNLAGSAFAARYLRLAGATIGRGCHIGSELIPVPSLLHLDDGATIGYATHLLGTEISDGRLVVGRVHLGRSVTVGANCVIAGPCHLGDGSVLRDQSAVQHGQHLPAGSVWQGSPAERRDTVDDPILEIMADCSQAPREWAPALKRRFAWGLVALEFAPLIALLPVVVLVWWVMIAFGLWPAFIITCLTGPVFVTTSCLVILALRRFGLPSTPVGIHHLRSRLGVEKWFADKLLSLSLLQTNTLYSTVYTPWWLRKLGAKIGARSEVSTIANIDPDLLTIGEESFVADMASVGSATYCNGHVAFRPTTIGKRAFVGNAAFVPSGNYLGDNSLLGVGSVPPTSGVPAGSSWLGSPSFYLPKREIYEEFTEEQTFAPSRWLVVARYIIEALRIVLPSSILAVSLFLTLNVTSMLAQEEAAMWQLILAVPALALAFGFGVVVSIALMKWLIVGRYKPRVEALWSLFVRRTEFVTGVYEAAAVPALLMLLQGTPMLGPVLRLYGMHVGRRSLIDTTYVTEFDLVRLGDDVAIGPAVSLQTHLFEDRVMKMNEVRVGDRVSAGTRTVILYQTDVGDDVDLAPLSLVMKGESLPAASAWAGIPAQPARRPSGADR